MSCLPDDKYLILKVYCSCLFDHAHLKKGNFTCSMVLLKYMWRVKEYMVKYFDSWFGGNWLVVTSYYAKSV